MFPFISVGDQNLLDQYHVRIEVDVAALSTTILFNEQRYKVSISRRQGGNRELLQLSDRQLLDTANKVAVMLLKKELLQHDVDQSHYKINRQGFTSLRDQRCITHEDPDQQKNTRPDYNSLLTYLRYQQQPVMQPREEIVEDKPVAVEQPHQPHDDGLPEDERADESILALPADPRSLVLVDIPPIAIEGDSPVREDIPPLEMDEPAAHANQPVEEQPHHEQPLAEELPPAPQPAIQRHLPELEIEHFPSTPLIQMREEEDEDIELGLGVANVALPILNADPEELDRDQSIISSRPALCAEANIDPEALRQLQRMYAEFLRKRAEDAAFERGRQCIQEIVEEEPPTNVMPVKLVQAGSDLSRVRIPRSLGLIPAARPLAFNAANMRWLPSWMRIAALGFACSPLFKAGLHHSAAPAIEPARENTPPPILEEVVQEEEAALSEEEAALPENEVIQPPVFEPVWPRSIDPTFNPPQWKWQREDPFAVFNDRRNRFQPRPMPAFQNPSVPPSNPVAAPPSPSIAPEPSWQERMAETMQNTPYVFPGEEDQLMHHHWIQARREASPTTSGKGFLAKWFGK